MTRQGNDRADKKIPFFLTAIGDLRMAPSTIKACVQTLHCRFNVECEYKEAVKICLCVCKTDYSPRNYSASRGATDRK